jgi:hypothetical protein
MHYCVLEVAGMEDQFESDAFLPRFVFYPATDSIMSSFGGRQRNSRTLSARRTSRRRGRRSRQRRGGSER